MAAASRTYYPLFARGLKTPLRVLLRKYGCVLCFGDRLVGPLFSRRASQNRHSGAGRSPEFPGIPGLDSGIRRNDRAIAQ